MEQLFNNAIVQLVAVFIAIWVFLKFCSFSKNFALPAGVKKWIYIITGLLVVGLNWAFSAAIKLNEEGEKVIGDPQMMLIAVVGAFVMVLVFSFALMSENKD